MNRLVFYTCVLLSPVPLPLRGAGGAEPRRDDAAVEKVVADSVKASQKMDWDQYADLVHPESLQDYKNMWLPVLQAATRERPEKQADLLSAFDKVTDLKTLISLEPKQFFVSSMKGMASQLHGRLDTSPLNVHEKIIGTVREGDDKAYVVVRTSRNFDGAKIARVEVVALKKSGSEWKLLLPDSVRIMAETFKRTGVDTQKSGPVKDRAAPDKPR